MNQEEYYRPLKEQILKLLEVDMKDGDKLIKEIKAFNLWHYIWVICQPYVPILSKEREN